jgi:hypothetical protein
VGVRVGVDVGGSGGDEFEFEFVTPSIIFCCSDNYNYYNNNKNFLLFINSIFY